MLSRFRDKTQWNNSFPFRGCKQVQAFSSSFQNQFSFWIVKQNTLPSMVFSLWIYSANKQKLSDKQDMLPLRLEEEAKTQKTFRAFKFQVWIYYWTSRSAREHMELKAMEPISLMVSHLWSILLVIYIWQNAVRLFNRMLSIYVFNVVARMPNS